MPILDLGPTYVDDSGVAKVSPHAIRLPNPPQLDIPPMQAPQGIAGLSPIPQGPGPMPANTPRYSIPSDMQRDIAMHPLNPADYEPHGARRVLNHIAGALLGAGQGLHGQPITGFQGLQDRGYNRAEAMRQSELKSLDPAVKFEEAQTRERGESERAAATLSSADVLRKSTESHQRAVEDEARKREEEIERRDLETEKARQENEARLAKQQELNEALRKQRDKNEQRRLDETESRDKQRLSLEARRLQLEADRLNKQAGDKGTWTVEKDDQGKTFLFNNKTRETAEAPSGGINRPADYEKGKGPKQAIQYATDYLASGIHTGPGDEALLEKFFELAKPSSGFRMTQPQMAMLQTARSWKEGIEARLRHAATGVWFSDLQRKQIADTMKALSAATPGQGSSSTAPSNENIKINHRRPVDGQ